MPYIHWKMELLSLEIPLWILLLILCSFQSSPQNCIFLNQKSQFNPEVTLYPFGKLCLEKWEPVPSSALSAFPLLGPLLGGFLPGSHSTHSLLTPKVPLEGRPVPSSSSKQQTSQIGAPFLDGPQVPTRVLYLQLLHGFWSAGIDTLPLSTFSCGIHNSMALASISGHLVS